MDLMYLLDLTRPLVLSKVNAPLLARIQKLERPEDVGMAFLDCVDLFKMYAVYCSNQARIISIIEEAKAASPELKRLDEKAQDDPKTRNQSLRDLLILPMQRVCRYPMLLETLAKHVDGPSLELDVINEALFRYKALVTQINEYTRRVENVSKLTAIEKRFRDGKTIGLVQPKRHFVFEGRLKMRLPRNMGITSNSEVDLQDGARCLLFDDLLLSCAPVDSDDPKSLLLVKFSLDLSHCFNVHVEDSTDEQNKAGQKIGFEVTFQTYAETDSSKSTQKKFKFKAPSSQDREAWVKKFRELPLLIARRDVAELSNKNRHLSGMRSEGSSPKKNAVSASLGDIPEHAPATARGPPQTATRANAPLVLPTNRGEAIAAGPQTARVPGPSSSIFTRGMGSSTKPSLASPPPTARDSVSRVQGTEMPPRTSSAPFKTRRLASQKSESSVTVMQRGEIQKHNVAVQQYEVDSDPEYELVESTSGGMAGDLASSHATTDLSASNTTSSLYDTARGSSDSPDPRSSDSVSPAPASHHPQRPTRDAPIPGSQGYHHPNGSSQTSTPTAKWISGGPPKTPLPEAPHSSSPATNSTASRFAQQHSVLSHSAGQVTQTSAASGTPGGVADFLTSLEPKQLSPRHLNSSSPNVSPGSSASNTRSPLNSVDFIASSNHRGNHSVTSPRLYSGMHPSSVTSSPASARTMPASPPISRTSSEFGREDGVLRVAIGGNSAGAAYGRFSGPVTSSTSGNGNSGPTRYGSGGSSHFSAGPGPLSIPNPTAYPYSGPLSPTVSGYSNNMFGFVSQPLESPSAHNGPSPAGFAAAWQQQLLRDLESVSLGYLQALQLLKATKDVKESKGGHKGEKPKIPDLPLERSALADLLRSVEEDNKEDLEGREAMKKALAVIKRRVEMNQLTPSTSSENLMAGSVRSTSPLHFSTDSAGDSAINRAGSLPLPLGAVPLRYSASLSNLDQFGDLLNTITARATANHLSSPRIGEDGESDASDNSGRGTINSARSSDFYADADDDTLTSRSRKTPRKSVEPPDMYTQVRRQNSDTRRASYSRSFSYGGHTTAVASRNSIDNTKNKDSAINEGATDGKSDTTEIPAPVATHPHHHSSINASPSHSHSGSANIVIGGKGSDNNGNGMRSSSPHRSPPRKHSDHIISSSKEAAQHPPYVSIVTSPQKGSHFSVDSSSSSSSSGPTSSAAPSAATSASAVSSNTNRPSSMNSSSSAIRKSGDSHSAGNITRPRGVSFASNTSPPPTSKYKKRLSSERVSRN